MSSIAGSHNGGRRSMARSIIGRFQLTAQRRLHGEKFSGRSSDQTRSCRRRVCCLRSYHLSASARLGRQSGSANSNRIRLPQWLHALSAAMCGWARPGTTWQRCALLRRTITAAMCKCQGHMLWQLAGGRMMICSVRAGHCRWVLLACQVCP